MFWTGKCYLRTQFYTLTLVTTLVLRLDNRTNWFANTTKPKFKIARKDWSRKMSVNKLCASWTNNDIPCIRLSAAPVNWTVKTEAFFILGCTILQFALREWSSLDCISKTLLKFHLFHDFFFQIMPLFLEIVVLYAGSFFLVYCFTTDHFLGCYWTALDWSFIAIIKFPFDCSLEVLQIVINYFIDNWKTRPTSVNLCRTVRECSQYS